MRGPGSRSLSSACDGPNTQPRHRIPYCEAGILDIFNHDSNTSGIAHIQARISSGDYPQTVAVAAVEAQASSATAPALAPQWSWAPPLPASSSPHAQAPPFHSAIWLPLQSCGRR